MLRASPIEWNIKISPASPSTLFIVTINAKKGLFSGGRNFYNHLFSAPSADNLVGSFIRPFFVALPGEISAFSRHAYTLIVVIL
jgi:hypothetical protein